MKSFFIHLIRRLPCCLIFFAFNCTQRTPALQQHFIDSASLEARIQQGIDSLYAFQRLVQNGDVITRTGNDFTSESLKTLNQRDQTYSHCGIASIEHDSVFVYHALGGEFNPDQKIRRDPYLLFAEPYNNRGTGIFRLAMKNDIKLRLLNTVKQFYRNGVMFDMDFDLSSNDRMYCAEFVYKSFLVASDSSIRFTFSRIGNVVFVGIDDIFLYKDFKPIRKFVY